MRNVLITGANRGLGLAFTRHYLNQGEHVWACYRQDAGQLTTLDEANLTLLKWDVSQDTPQDTLGKLPDAIDLLINNAGIYGPTKSNGQSLDSIQAQDMLHVFEVNCVGPLRVVQTLKNRVIKAKGIIANISSKMGSTADNSSGGCYAYRASKAALVIVSRSMAVDLEPHGVRVITLHPGWVKTDMTGHTGEINAEESVAGMTQVLAQVDSYIPGDFVAWDQQRVPY
jgi:NAD(P)-dependent dehydrogenase (short-subunit alcohol dehydrogenase family)